MLDILMYQLCSIQGRLFELAAKKGYDSEEFITTYMNSDLAWHYNSEYDDLQWRGEEYILAVLEEQHNFKQGNVYALDIVFWTGYLYCYWHYKTNDSCKQIVKIAPPKIMAETYMGFHTIAYELAIENLMYISMENQLKTNDKDLFLYYPNNILNILLTDQISSCDDDYLQNMKLKCREVEVLSYELEILRKRAEISVILSLLRKQIDNHTFSIQSENLLKSLYENIQEDIK